MREFTSIAVTLLAVFAIAASPAAAADDDKTVTEKVLDILKQQGSIDEAQYEALKREAEQERQPIGTPAVSAAGDDPEGWKAYWKDGTRIERNDGSVKIKLGGRVQFDFAGIGAENDVQDTIEADFDDSVRGTGTEFRRARLFVEGAVEDMIFKAQYDFAGNDADFKDVYGGLQHLPWVGTLRIGHFKESFGLEELTSSKYITFMERSLPSEAFAPSRNSGIALNNTAFDERLTWAIGAFQDVGDDGGAFSNQSMYNITGRITGLPVYEDEGKKLVHVGYSYSHQFVNHETVTFDSRPEAHLAPNLVSTENFDDVMESDGVDLFGFEFATVHGPLSTEAEFMAALVGRNRQSDRTFYGASAQVSYFLTGENRVYETNCGCFGRTKPLEPFSLSKGQWGGLEVAGRFSHLTLNDGSVRGGILNDYTLGVNWYLYSNLRFMVNGIISHLNGVGNTYIAQSRVSLDF